MKFLLGLLLLFLFHTVSYSHSATSVPPTLVTDLSKKVISINVNFSGSKFHIFGAAKRGFSQTASIDQPPFDILIEVIGPSVSLDLFKKERLYGFWVNKKIHTFEAIPSFSRINFITSCIDLGFKLPPLTPLKILSLLFKVNGNSFR